MAIVRPAEEHRRQGVWLELLDCPDRWILRARSPVTIDARNILYIHKHQRVIERAVCCMVPGIDNGGAQNRIALEARNLSSSLEDVYTREGGWAPIDSVLLTGAVMMCVISEGRTVRLCSIRRDTGRLYLPMYPRSHTISSLFCLTPTGQPLCL